MTFFTVHPFHSFNLAVVLLIAGKILTLNIDLLRRYSIPEPVAGGFLCIAVTGLLWALFDLKVSFEVGIRDFLLLVFFAGIGLKSDIRTLLAGGRPLVILLILATSFILLQNFAGMGLARLFGMEPKAGLMVGSVSLTGGVGTTLAWAPIFAEKLGITNALELGVAANTVGLIAACVIGGPIAALLEDLKDQLKSDSADLKHTGDRWGGSISAALFLREFVGGLPNWVHCDIAGPAMGDRVRGWDPKGGTGHGVLTFVEVIDRAARSVSTLAPAAPLPQKAAAPAPAAPESAPAVKTAARKAPKGGATKGAKVAAKPAAVWLSDAPE